MTTRPLALAAMLASLFATIPAFGQQSAKADEQYIVLSYFKVDAQNQAAYEEMLRTTSKQFYTELMNQPGSNMWSWNAARVMFGGTREDTPTHVTAAIYNGPPPGAPDPAVTDSIMKKVSGMEPAEYRRKLASLREPLGTELIRGIAWTPTTSPEGSYRVTSYAKAELHRAADFRAQSQNVWQPVMAAAARDGKILSWSTWSYVFPRGGDATHDILTATSYKDLPSAVQGYLASAADFLKVHPNGAYVNAVDLLRDSRRVSMTTVSRVLAITSKNVTRQ